MTAPCLLFIKEAWFFGPGLFIDACYCIDHVDCALTLTSEQKGRLNEMNRDVKKTCFFVPPIPFIE